jgi:hypothetical protein
MPLFCLLTACAALKKILQPPQPVDTARAALMQKDNLKDQIVHYHVLAKRKTA